MSNYNCLTMMILRKCRANYEELTSLINNGSRLPVCRTCRDISHLQRLLYLQEYTAQKGRQNPKDSVSLFARSYDPIHTFHDACFKSSFSIFPVSHGSN